MKHMFNQKRESGTFQHSAAAIFDKLPVAIRNITEYNSFWDTFYVWNLKKQTQL